MTNESSCAIIRVTFIKTVGKLKIVIAIFIGVYFIMLATVNSTTVNVILPFVTTFYNVPLFVIVIVAAITGITLQYLTSFGGKKKK